MKKIGIPCFFMLCTDGTEKECLEKGLFGDRESWFPYLKTIRKGDIGFLLNITRDQLLGIFIAEGEARLNINPNAWDGAFTAQVKVKLIDQLQRVDKSSEKLEKIIALRKIQREPFPYNVPSKKTYGPDITSKILSLFRITDTVADHFEITPQEQVGLYPEYKLEGVAGLDGIKRFVFQRILAPFEDEETAYKLGLRIGGGLLLFGPPGTGKTLVSMAIANHIQAKFIDISPSVIIGYPGEAEKRIENIFASLDKEPRAVVFLDEAEWALCKREDQTSSVMQRITPVLLAQLSRIFKQKTKPIILIAATNKPAMIDTAFLRPGRFDRIFYIGLPDENTRAQIIKICLQNRENELSEDEISEIAGKLEGYSGADIENIIEEAAFISFERRRAEPTKITKEHIIKAFEKMPNPSVTEKEVKQIEKWAKERGIEI
ncbi:MAG: AAA family ATPase [Bacteroidales bacterium]|nr:AAA family ATPase [Bacteroidales bacterium]